MDTSISRHRVVELQKSERLGELALAEQLSKLLAETVGKLKHNLRYACNPVPFATWPESRQNCSSSADKIVHVLNLGKMTELGAEPWIPVWFSGDELLFVDKEGGFLIGCLCPFGNEHYHSHGIYGSSFTTWQRCEFVKVIAALERVYTETVAKRQLFLDDIRESQKMLIRLRRVLNGEESASC